MTTDVGASPALRGEIQALGARLKTLRMRAGLNGREAADALRWHSSKVSRLERGRCIPSAADLEAWVGMCGANERVLASLINDLGEVAKSQALAGGALRLRENPEDGNLVVSTEPVTLNNGRRVRFALYMVPEDQEDQEAAPK